MSEEVRAEWRGREAFTEPAMCLGIASDLVMGAMERDGVMVVLYTPFRESATDPDAVRQVSLVRGDDGVLRQETFSKQAPLAVRESLRRMLG